jgi:hypothetical protein
MAPALARESLVLHVVQIQPREMASLPLPDRAALETCPRALPPSGELISAEAAARSRFPHLARIRLAAIRRYPVIPPPNNANSSE